MMIPDKNRSWKRLAGCYKRALAMAQKGYINPEHTLAISWANSKMVLDDGDRHGMRSAESFLFDLSVLDWFARRVELFAENHMLADDESVAAILHEWLQRMPLDPRLMANAWSEK